MLTPISWNWQQIIVTKFIRPAQDGFPCGLAWELKLTYSWRAKVNSPRCTRKPPL
jgi:hypothetical protein